QSLLRTTRVDHLSAQVYTTSVYSPNEGLVQSQVMSLLEDRRGYLWLGTHGGIDRFDGQSFVHFGEAEGVTGNYVNDLLEDSRGRIWAATNQGLSRFRKKQFTTITTADGLPDNDLLALMEDQSGHLWIATQTHGICRYDDHGFESNFLQWEAKPEELIVHDLWQTQSGEVWIGTNEGLFRYQEGERVRKVRLREEVSVNAILEDRSGQLWLGTNEGLWKKQGTAFLHIPVIGTRKIDREIICMADGGGGVIWLGTDNGIFRFDGRQAIPINPQDQTLSFRIASAIVDDEGNIWLGTDGGGARKLTEGTFSKVVVQNGLTSNLAKSFLEAKDGTIWISTKDRGISLWRNGQVVQTYSQESDGLGGDDICSSYEDAAGNFWFASYNGTLTRYDGNRFQAFDEKDGLNCNAVYFATEGINGELWVGTDNGVFAWNQGTFRRLPGQDILPSQIIYSLLKDQAGRVWIGTSEGMGRWENGGFRVDPEDEGMGTYILTLLEDPAGRIWIGSSEGLICWENENVQPIRISGTRGASTVVSLVMEGEHALWIGTENGVYRLWLPDYAPEKRNTFEHYIQSDGLPSMECNANAALLSRSGNIWLGTVEGAIVRNPDASTKQPPAPLKVYITDVKGTQDTSSWRELGFEVNEFALPKKLRLPYQENRLEFEFIGISLKSPDQVEYQIKLEGLEKDWSRSLRQTQFVYPNLDPGSYTFRVRAKLETEEWANATEAEFPFVIRSPFWATWWFITIASLMLIAIGWGISQFYANRRKQLAEEKRIRHLAEKLQLEHQALYAMMNPHFTFNALQSIQYFIHRQDRKSANKFLSSFAKLVRKNLESTKADFISLAEEIDRLKLYLSLEKMRFPEKFDYQVEIDGMLDLAGTQLPPMLLQPFVENSIKHGIMSLETDGQIDIMVEEAEEGYLHILIKDNGIGIEASKARKANRPSDHVSKGMQITLDRLALFARMTGKTYQLDIREWQLPDGSVGGTQVDMVMPLKTESMLV
ncbi:MAG: two-component regulator propeller domain-containing protein, partial [Bacteroidota bacterium]